MLNISLTIFRIVLPEQLQCRDTCRSALGVIVFNHDPPKHLCRIQVFQSFRSSRWFVTADTTRSVLKPKNDINRPFDPFIGHKFRKAGLRLQHHHRLDDFGCTIADRVTLVLITESPRAFGRIAITLFLVRTIFQRLLIFKIPQSLDQHRLPSLRSSETTLHSCLNCECRVPVLHAVCAVHEHTFVLHPEEIFHSSLVSPHRIRVGSFLNVTGEKVHWSIYRSKVRVVSVYVFHLNQFPRPSFGLFFDAGG